MIDKRLIIWMKKTLFLFELYLKEIFLRLKNYTRFIFDRSETYFTILNKIRSPYFWFIFSSLINTLTFPNIDSCATMKCSVYQTCVRYSDGRSQCVCKTCDNNYDMVCGDDLKTYASPCRMQRSMCLHNTPSRMAAKRPCRKFLLNIFRKKFDFPVLT